MSIAIIISGLPASGKSTVGRLLADTLGRKLLDKDDFLEDLFRLHDNPDPSNRSGLSRQADIQFIAEAKGLANPVLVSHWRRPELSETSGTPIDWFDVFDGLVEIYCDCPADVAAVRFKSRVRHPSHGDTSKGLAELLRWFGPLADLGPLGVGLLRRVDTGLSWDLDT